MDASRRWRAHGQTRSNKPYACARSRHTDSMTRTALLRDTHTLNLRGLGRKYDISCHMCEQPARRLWSTARPVKSQRLLSGSRRRFCTRSALVFKSRLIPRVQMEYREAGRFVGLLSMTKKKQTIGLSTSIQAALRLTSLVEFRYSQEKVATMQLTATADSGADSAALHCNC